MIITEENITTGIYLFFVLTEIIILFGALIIYFNRSAKKKGRLKNEHK